MVRLPHFKLDCYLLLVEKKMSKNMVEGDYYPQLIERVLRFTCSQPPGFN